MVRKPESGMEFEGAPPQGRFRSGTARVRRALSLLGGRAVAFLVLVLSLVITAVGWEFTQRAASTQTMVEFNALVRGIADDIHERMVTYDEMVYSSRAFILASTRITKTEWLAFQGEQFFEATHPGSLGVGYAMEVRRADVQRYVRLVRRQDGIEYKIWPPGERPVYAPIRFSAFRNKDTRALGLDMYTDQRRRAAMERARDTNKPALSEIVTLWQAGPKEASKSIVLFLPVYSRDLPATAPAEERRAALLGYVYCPILMDEFLKDVEAELAEQRIALQILDQNGETILDVPRGAEGRSEPFTFVEESDIYGQSWSFRYVALPGFARAAGNGQAPLVAGGGLIISLLLFAVVWTITSTKLRAENLAKGMTRNLRESEERFKSLTELSADWYWEQDEHYRFTSRSGGGHGWSRAAVINGRGKTRWELPAVGVSEKDWERHRATLDARRPFRDFRFKRYDDAGVLRHISVSGEPVFDEQGVFRGYRGVGQDVTDRVLAEEQVQYLAYNDNLTGLPNRSNFSLLLNHAIKRARRQKKGLALLFIDLDRFKVINDTLGHDAGDALLKEVAQRLKRAVRQNDTIARWGGDEFVVLLEDITDPVHVGTVAGKILGDLVSATKILASEFRVTTSIGISLHPRDGEDEEALIKNADLAMYQAKEKGRNNYQFYFPKLNEEAALRLDLETSLRNALEREEFVLHYQPKANLTDGVVSGLEALLRWKPSGKELVSPAQFVPMLESTGMIVAVGEWTLRTVCAQLRAWEAEGIAVPPIAINLSARQLEQGEFSSLTRETIAVYGVNPALIKFEITESMLMRKPDEVVEVLEALARLGIRLSVDDFGTGYSSLSYLRRFPLHELKIDKSFIQDVVVDADSASIVVAMIQLAHNLQLSVVAEGVETRAQLLFLRAHGCDEMQGYYFAKPLAAADCGVILREDRRLPIPDKDSSGDRPGILIVDDNDLDLHMIQRAMVPLGYQIFLATTAREALVQLAEHAIICVISDQNMPNTKGVTLMNNVRALYPGTVRILISGAGTAETLTEGINSAGIHKYLEKNWPPERIRAEVHEALQRNQVAS